MKKNAIGHIQTPLKRVHIELTNICDFNCVFCPKGIMKRPYGYMDPALAMRAIEEIKKHDIAEKVTFHVMGEPTMHREFFSILEFAESVKMPVGLTTNGSRLGAAVGKRLLDHPLHQVDVSLQTPDEKSFTLRKPGNLKFDDYVAGILDFFASYKKKYNDSIFKFRFLNTRFQKKTMKKQLGLIEVMSTNQELRATFSLWLNRVYDILDVEDATRKKALAQIGKLVSYKWNVVEVFPKVFFETYVLDDWGHGFDAGKVREAWGGYCFGMKDHFSILYNGDVTLCCIDYDGNTSIGNLNNASLVEILSSKPLGDIMKGFKKYQLIHPYCKRCLGSKSLSSWLTKPILSIIGLKILKPYFYNQTKIY
jgi:MoaA/NifB/PqqE/SkfB family radical SAM enzyme